MPQIPVPPPQAPIPIQVIDYQKNSDRPEWLNDSPTSIMEQSSPENSEAKQSTIPSVVEVYYTDPKIVEPIPTDQEKAQTTQSATVLGSPITVKYQNYQNLRNSVEMTRLITSDRTTSESRQFDFANGTTETQSTEGIESTNPSEVLPPIETINVVEVIADEQEYNQNQQIINAQGNVEMRFAKAVLMAERLEVNLKNRIAVASGEVILRRGDQVLRGNRFEYYFVEDRGVIFNASGEIYQPTTARDFGGTLPNSVEWDTIPEQPLSDELQKKQPLQRVTGTEGYTFVGGSVKDLRLLGEQGGSLPGTISGGQVNRLRFEAEKLEFEGSTWTASNIRLTNDPFSPPELEVQADTAEFKQIAPLVDQLTTTNSRVVLDQSVTLPTFRNKLVFDRRPRQPGIVNIAFDGEERGGLYIERTFNIIDTQQTSFQVTPQYFLQKALFPGAFGLNNDDDDDGGILSPSVFGVKTRFQTDFTHRTRLIAKGDLTSLQADEIGNNLEANVRLQQKVGEITQPYTFSLEYNYRDRLFNGSLGFQRVQSSFGLVVTSPVVFLGDTNISLSYQGGIQNIDADTDREDLLSPDRDNDRINLTRYQTAASLSHGLSLWQGEPLPATREEGLKYTPTPVMPFLRLVSGVTGVTSFYSNGDSQPSLSGTIGIEGQLGHFSRSYLDYTGFNLRYTQGIGDDSSPFEFDRYVDRQIISIGLTQQVYGPIRAGVQTSFNLDNDDNISTDYLIEYSRRTYNLILRYNPVLEIGSINFRISDFNWIGDPEPFQGTGITPVIQGVTRE